MFIERDALSGSRSDEADTIAELFPILLVTMILRAPSREFAPMKSDVRDQDRHEGYDYDFDSETGLAMTIPSWNGLKDASTDKGEGDCVGTYHPFAMLLDVPITRCQEGGGRGEYPRSGLDNICRDEMNSMWIVAMV